MTILLNMIVKNEEKIILKTLQNLTSKIDFDYWVISDTGSTDNTITIITDFFKEKGIEGELFQDEWRDFGYNRTLALSHAYNKSDVLFVFDADDYLENTITIPKVMPSEIDSYHFRFGGKGLKYWRVCAVNNRLKWEYVGVLHEYINRVDGINRTSYLIDGDYYIVHGTSGSRHTLDQSSTDAEILSEAYAKLETDIVQKSKYPTLLSRYMFYCANCYRDAGDVEKAEKWYLKVLESALGWKQEKYIACIELAKIYGRTGMREKFVYYCIESIKYDNQRVEGITQLVKYYYDNENYTTAYSFYKIVSEWYEKYYVSGVNLEDKLFVEYTFYNFILPFFMINVCYHVKDYVTGIKMFKYIFKINEKIDNTHMITDLYNNYTCYIPFFSILHSAEKEYINTIAETYFKHHNITVKAI